MPSAPAILRSPRNWAANWPSGTFAFIVLPGGIGTLEEAVEILSWARLGLHAKPMAFLDEDGFWIPFFDLMEKIIDGGFTPESFRSLLVHSDSPETAIQALRDRMIVLDA